MRTLAMLGGLRGVNMDSIIRTGEFAKDKWVARAWGSGGGSGKKGPKNADKGSVREGVNIKKRGRPVMSGRARHRKL